MKTIQSLASATPPINSSALSVRIASPAANGEIDTFPLLDSNSLILGGLVIIGSIVAAIYARIPMTIQRSSSLKSYSNVQCFKCQYFSQNPYVKCALHPDTVLTEQAVDCRDYHSGSMTEPFEG